MWKLTSTGMRLEKYWPKVLFNPAFHIVFSSSASFSGNGYNRLKHSLAQE